MVRLHESDPDGYGIDIVAHIVAQPADRRQAGSIFLGGDDALGRRQSLIRAVDVLQVFPAEVVVVGKSERRQLGRVRRDVLDEVLWRSNAREQQHVFIFEDIRRLGVVVGVVVGLRVCFLAKERVGHTIVERGEKEVLVGE